MRPTRLRTAMLIGTGVLLVLGVASGPAAAEHTHGSGQGTGHGPKHGAHCSSGARTLSHYGDHVYPDTGNGGYRSVHTDVHLVYDSASNTFLDGTHVDLTDRATHCLTDLSLDFERTSAAEADGPDMRVQSVTVNGRPAVFRFAQPTYPGDPNGPDDPNPLAHEASQRTPVGGPQNNPYPPACSPQLTVNDPDGQDGEQCPANKLVITPGRPIKQGRPFVVTVNYVGRPGLHVDGDGSTEGWFRSAPDGSFVTTEPVGTEDWMPLNDHPSAKPTYDIYDTVNAGKTAVANGILVSTAHYGASAQFPNGSTTFHWHSAAPVASYLVENSIGDYHLTWRDAADGIRYYEAQSDRISPAQRQANLAIMNQQQDITDFQSRFNGRFPFSSDGVLVGFPEAGFEEEMQTMITFEGGFIDLDTFNHENMHQWWGDNVTEANYNMTFFKEGMATFGEFLYSAGNAATSAGGLGTPAGDAAFQQSLVRTFDSTYASNRLWSGTPSDPSPVSLFSGSSTYTRPGIAYIALRQILGPKRFDRALQHIQRKYGGSSITEPELEAAFAQWLPTPRPTCRAMLGTFFRQWFDTRYPTAAGAGKPTITGPGLAGGGFAC